MKNRILIYIPLLVSSIFISCNIFETHDEKPQFNFITEINVVEFNGNNHKIIADGWDSKVLQNRNRIIFNNKNNLYTINFNGSDQIQITNLSYSLFDYNISLNGEKIILSLFENNPVKMYLINSDGTNFTQLTNSEGVDLEPSFSDNSNEITFRRDWNICTINVSGTEFRYINNHPDSSYYRNPRFIFNNKKIIYTEETKTSKFFIHIYDLDTESDSVLTNLHQQILDISSISEILFIDSSKIKILDIMNNEIKELAEGQHASFSRDGNKVVYSNGKQIYLTDSDGTNSSLIYTENDDKKWIANPKLSPNNNYITFETSYSVEIN